MSNTFDWIEIRTADIARTSSFYENLFGWRMTAQETVGGSEVRIFDTGSEPRLENLRRGGIWLRPKGEALGIVVYVVVDDIDWMLDRVVQLGGTVKADKAPLGAGYGAYFEDPSGNLLGLYEDKPEDQTAQDSGL